MLESSPYRIHGQLLSKNRVALAASFRNPGDVLFPFLSRTHMHHQEML